MSTLREFLKITQTRIGIVFAFFVPIVFMLVWMTGYHGATERIDRLNVAFVNQSGASGAILEQKMMQNAPFHSEQVTVLADALKRMDKGEFSMVTVIPNHYEDNLASSNAEITYYINEAASDVAKSILENSAQQLTNGIAQNIQASPLKATIIKTHAIGDFATSMLPMLMGFVPYIAMMTMNIQFNISSQILKRTRTWREIFWSRQWLLAAIAIILPAVLSCLALLFTSTSSSFGALWGFQILVITACIATTQMAFVLFGSAAPLFNVALIPFQLMTAGNIIPSDMLSPFYRPIGQFLPVPNATQGFMKLIYSGQSVATQSLHLVLIIAVAWGLTVLLTARSGRAALKQGTPRQTAAH